METPKHVSDELRKEVIEKFNLDPINNTGLIEAISFLYERNNKLEEMINEIAKNVSEGDLILSYKTQFGPQISKESLFDKWNKNGNS